MLYFKQKNHFLKSDFFVFLKTTNISLTEQKDLSTGNFCAAGGTRTLMLFQTLDFKSNAYTNSATAAIY